VLHGVDIDIGPGETLGLLGRNGMGKSTLIRTLLGHVARRDGSIRMHGSDLLARPAARGGAPRRGLRARGRGVFGNLSVRENLVMAARPPRRAAAAGPSIGCCRPFRAWPSGCITWAASSRAASSRWSPSAAH
jgi:branched-chain amino acid transport system ATP-binding protein